MYDTLFRKLQDKIQVLTATTWRDRDLTWEKVERWLEQFNRSEESKSEKIQLLFLVSNFMYFGRMEIREMLKSIFRDLYRYPIVEKIRKNNDDTKDRNLIDLKFREVLSKTRFLGVGNPSESGTHLLYFFRQENNLSKELFINGHQIYSRTGSHGLSLKDSEVENYIFIDDICGSGTQAAEYSVELVEPIKKLKPTAHVAYYSLFGTTEGLHYVRSNTKFDIVESIFQLDETFKCFSEKSRYYAGELDPINRQLAMKLCEEYGRLLLPKEPGNVMGYKNGQLLLGFYHNTPDNTLPIFWFSEEYAGVKVWQSLFQRYHKIY